ncbi:MAG: arsenate reductase (glutaredoxin) [Chitinophagaceae bacterium]|nr:arsenate reductase (glutaredoxin) [Chitinophagaceae bacterium]MCB9044552.1 arsenate reductase (glutaredoxin) [Chitinophagales bacterium]
MSDYILYHKPNCSTSLSTLKMLKDHGVRPELRLYLEDPPTQKELAELMKKLGCKPIELVRTKEPLYKENYADKKLTKKEWLKILAEHPILIERPILIKGDKAILGRPPEKVLELL